MLHFQIAGPDGLEYEGKNIDKLWASMNEFEEGQCDEFLIASQLRSVSQ